MVDAFATAQEAEAILGRSFPPEQLTQIDKLLEAASTKLRDLIGQQVWPTRSATFTAWPSRGEVAIPQQPVVDVTAVTDMAGTPVEFRWIDDRIEVGTSERVRVTFAFGYGARPDGLKDWTIVLVSQALTTLELNLGLTAGGLSSVAIDDFRASWADGGAQSGMELPAHVVESLRAQYGAPDSTSVIGMR